MSGIVENVDSRSLEAAITVRWAQEHRPSLGWLGIARLGPHDAVMTVRETDDGSRFEGYLSLSFGGETERFRGMDGEALKERLADCARRDLAWNAEVEKEPYFSPVRR